MNRYNNRHILMGAILPVALCLLAADKGGATGTAVAEKPKTDASPKPTTDGGARTKAQPEAKVHTQLMEKIKLYDESVAKAESYYVEIIEIIQTEKVSRADVVATLMKGRGISFETAQSQYSRMKNIWQNPEVLKQLKDGEITLKIAREKTTKKQAGTEAKAAGTAQPTGAGGEKETKEARFDRCRKAFVAATKECGYDLRSVMVSVEADLKAAGIK